MGTNLIPLLPDQAQEGKAANVEGDGDEAEYDHLPHHPMELLLLEVHITQNLLNLKSIHDDFENKRISG